MGKLSKQVFKHFAESTCDRRLFLELGDADERWISPARTLKPRDLSNLGQRARLLAMGHNYEEEVYKALSVASPLEVLHDRSTSGHFNACALTAARLDELGDKLDEHGQLCLIEHEFEVPYRWPRQIFELADDAPLPLTELSPHDAS